MNKRKREAVKDDAEDAPSGLITEVKAKKVQRVNKKRKCEEVKDGGMEVAPLKPRTAVVNKAKERILEGQAGRGER